MKQLSYHLMNTWLLFLRPFMFAIKSKANPNDPTSALNIGKALTVYVLTGKSYIDYLVLYYFCRKRGLPTPSLFDKKSGDNKGHARCIFLERNIDEQSESCRQLRALLDEVKENDKHTQLVPVSIFWGKNPGREDSSIARLLFNEEGEVGSIRKFFIILFHGRNSEVYFSKPLDLRAEELNPSMDKNRHARKLARLFRMYDRRLRITVLGKKLYNREQVISRIANGKAVRQEIEREAKQSSGGSIKSLEIKARRYARELAADQTYSMIRLFEIVLGRLWNKIFDGVEIINIDNVTRFAKQNYEIVYVPTHRSHLDYLLTSYTIHKSGLPAPHIAAGINLNFWPMGWFLRRAGAFFIRRSFRGNRLYSSVVNEYMHFLLKQGYPITYFPEGGRSRTGRLLSMRTGMLSMTLQSFLRDHSKPVVLVPVSISYDRVMEVRSYLNELSGKRKRKESMFQLFQARKLLKAYYGKAYVSFGEPLILENELNHIKPGWVDLVADDERPDWLPSVVHKLADELAKRMNQTVVLSPVSLVGLGLLSSPHKALPADELKSFISMLLNLHQQLPYHLNVKSASESCEDILEKANKLDVYSHFRLAGDDVLHLSEIDSILISYYRNNVVHVFAIPSLIARFFRYQAEVSLDDIINGCAEIYPIIKEEYTLSWDEDCIGDIARSYVDAMIQLGLIVEKGSGLYQRPERSFDQFENLSLLGNLLGLAFERYTLTVSLLSKYSSTGYVNENSLHEQCRQIARRMAILNGVNNPEFVEKSFYENQIKILKKKGLIKPADEGRLEIDGRLAALASSSQKLLSPDARYTIERIFSKH